MGLFLRHAKFLSWLCVNIVHIDYIAIGAVAQLVRALGLQPRGHGFESRQLHKTSQARTGESSRDDQPCV